ncbi:hypothetical protein [Paenibacillus macerans]|uniref:hypothetical protein n=1 Tax=Paenibacillus macerans TaxID=44252 RepID=UPI000E010329|nr:hypothetical protein [Paenibacillus macerans]SUA86626.1 Uncharacterised protein [Paenibacillus macerans]
MTIDGTNLLQNLKDAKNSVRDYKPFQIGIVAGPVDPALPDSTREVSYNEISRSGPILQTPMRPGSF